MQLRDRASKGLRVGEAASEGAKVLDLKQGRDEGAREGIGLGEGEIGRKAGSSKGAKDRGRGRKGEQR